MAPEDSTFGKKRNFLKSFGPKGPKESAACQEASAEQAGVIQASEGSNLVSTSAHLRYDDRVEMSRALLEKIETTSGSLSDPKLYNMAQVPPLLVAPPVKPRGSLDQKPVTIKAEYGTGGSKDGRHYLDYPGGIKTSRKTKKHEIMPNNLQMTHQNDALNASSKGHCQPHGTSIWIDPLRCHPVECFQESSTQGLGGVADIKLPSAAAAAGWSHDQINTKVTEMLAATEALKPQGQAGRSSHLRETIPQSASSRVLAKVSNAWGRLYPKSSKEVSKRQGYSKSVLLPSNVNLKTPSTQRSSCHLDGQAIESPPKLTTVEIRLNEGNNLNKKKVQRLIGGQVNRKPLADDGKSLRSGRSISGASGSPDLRITPGFQSGRSKRSSLGNQHSKVTPVPANPFESEREFFGDLDQGLLSTPPTGCSTPRIRPGHRSSALADESPLARRHHRAKSDSASISLNQMSNAEAVSPHEKHPSHDSILGSAQYLERTKALLDLNGLSRPKMKKHPSPNKRDLELLQMALERMSPPLRKSARENRGLDELAGPNPSTLRLGPRDPNRSLGAHRVSKSMSDTVSPQMATTPGQSRVPRQVDKFPSLNTQRRIALPFRPPCSDADDEDELL